MQTEAHVSGRRGAIAILALYAVVVIGLSSVAAWLLLPAPTVRSTGGIMFSDILPTDSFSLEIKQDSAGRQTVTIGNTSARPTSIALDLDIPADTPPDTWATTAFPNDRNAIPATTTTTVAIRPAGPCQPGTPSPGNVSCGFTLAPTETRTFSWQHPQESWVAHRGSRWSVLTPIVRMNNVGYPSIVEQNIADPHATITAAVPLPPGSAVVSGPPLSWDYDEEAATFTYAGTGHVNAPLVIDYATEHTESFLLFGIAAILGAALGAAPQIISTTTKRFKSHRRSH